MRQPGAEELQALLGEPLYGVWTALSAMIEERYDMERLWNGGGKAWTYEYKYRRGGKTLCAMYAGERRLGLMLIFGRGERERFEAGREGYSPEIQTAYDGAKTYRDGKWVMFTPVDTSLFQDFERLLRIKRKPNRKAV